MLLRLFSVSCLALVSLTPTFAKTPRQMADVKINLQRGDFKKISQYRGKVVLLGIFSTDCESCQQAATILNKIQTEFAAKGVQVLGAAVNKAAPKDIVAWSKPVKPIYPLGTMDEATTRLAADLGDKGEKPYVPILIFIDRKGDVQIQLAGDSPAFEQFGTTIRAALNNLLLRK
ncbi:MAG: TlpA disulfide reductase family protein [Acidobacteriota bacterium]